MKKLAPTTEELQAQVSKDWSKLKRNSKKHKIKTSAKEYVKETQREEKRVEELMRDWSRGGHDHFTLKKEDGTFRVLWENFNSLSILTDERNLAVVRALDARRKRYKADMIAGCETQTNWFKVPEHLRFDRLVGMGEDRDFVLPHTMCMTKLDANLEGL